MTLVCKTSPSLFGANCKDIKYALRDNVMTFDESNPCWTKLTGVAIQHPITYDSEKDELQIIVAFRGPAQPNPVIGILKKKTS